MNEAAHQKPGDGVAVLALALLLGIQPVTTDLYLPALPELGAPMAGAQLTLSALMLAFGLGQLLLGPLADRYGRRPVLLGGLSLYLLAALAAAAAGGIAQLVAWRALQGLGLAASVVCGRAMLRDWFEPQQGAQVMARALTGLGILATLSPGIGGALTELFGWRSTLLATAAFAAAALGFIALRVPESLAARDPLALRPAHLLQSWALVLRHPTFRAYGLMTALGYGTLYTFLAGSSFVFIGILQVSRQSYGLMVGACAAVYVLGTLACRRLLPRHGIAATAKRGAAFTLAGGLSVAGLALAGVESVWALLLPQWLLIFGHGILQPCGQTGAVGPFPQRAGVASAWAGFLIALTAFLVGAWLSHALARQASVLTLALTLCAMALATVLVSWTWVQRPAPALQAPAGRPT
ncbi:MFS transporter [Roseateles violae]|uniref:MFS transporter n=1 Tax=Roseateles violae TaxID=3058042 RepID=A0ABT8DWN0_9BURK|nr:MFS transporter [Pelomonas sp. PFR6]MDN3920611.1 MFS transporter [Pelomonas sp. PFR6]